MELNFVDFAIIGTVALSAFFGFRKGLIEEIFWLIGIAFGLILASYFQDDLIRFIQARWDIPLIKNLAGFFVIIVLSTILVFSILARIVTFLSRRHLTLTIGNRIGGALFGILRGLIIASIVLILILTVTTSPAINLQIYKSTFSSSILRYSLKIYAEIVRILPQGKAFSHLDVIKTIPQRSKDIIDQSKKDNYLDIYQKFIDRLAEMDVEDSAPLISEKLRNLKRGGGK